MIGECGIDYDRLRCASKKQQLLVFRKHFELAEHFKLPLYLHSRNTGSDFNQIVKENRHRFPGGVVHSFTGTIDELKELLDLFIGVNGCSLKTYDNLEMVKSIPLDKLLLETDAPYC